MFKKIFKAVEYVPSFVIYLYCNSKSDRMMKNYERMKYIENENKLIEIGDIFSEKFVEFNILMSKSINRIPVNKLEVDNELILKFQNNLRLSDYFDNIDVVIENLFSSCISYRIATAKCNKYLGFCLGMSLQVAKYSLLNKLNKLDELDFINGPDTDSKYYQYLYQYSFDYRLDPNEFYFIEKTKMGIYDLVAFDEVGIKSTDRIDFENGINNDNLRKLPEGTYLIFLCNGAAGHAVTVIRTNNKIILFEPDIGLINSTDVNINIKEYHYYAKIYKMQLI